MKVFASFELYVRNVQATIAFLKDVFDGKVGYTDDNFGIVWFGKTRVIINELSLDEFREPNPVLREGALQHLGSGVEIVLSVDDLDAVRQKLIAHGITSINPTVKQPWGLQDFRFLLEDGYYIRVTEADEDVARVW